MGIKEKFSDISTATKEQISSIKNDSLYLKDILKTDEVVFIKTDAIVGLVRKKGNEDNFLAALDKITREGYVLMLQEDVTDPVPGLNIKLASVFYFQHKKFIKNEVS